MTNDKTNGSRLSTDDAAVYIGLGRQTLAKLRVYGGGPRFMKLGRRVVYDSRDLDSWMESRKRSSTSEGE